MQIIETLRLRSKLFLLFVLVTFGLISIGVMGAINASDTKKNIDTLYFGSFVPVTELHEILQSYHADIESVLYRSHSADISVEDTSVKIKKSLAHIENVWKSYESHYKRVEELPYTQYVALEIQKTNDFFKNKSYKEIPLTHLDAKISHIDEVIQKLLHYEKELAKSSRVEFLEEYNGLMLQSNIILGFEILIVLFILYSVFRGISKDQYDLLEVTQKLQLLNKKLENASYTDSLTGMYNRRYFNLVLNREIKRAQRERSVITFMMLDIDFFKQFNDTYGHIKGDEALQKVASVLQNSLRRPSDFSFRLGGEEFGVLLTQTNQQESELIAKRICTALLEEQIPHSGSGVHRFLTLSVGVAIFIADEKINADTMMTLADNMLYDVKDNGRNGYKAVVNL